MKRRSLAPLHEAVYVRDHARCRHCAGPGSEMHHVLFRKPGGNRLDELALDAMKDGSFDPDRHLAHLLLLCAKCHHGLAHGPDSVELGLRILGQVVTERWSGQTFYQGPNRQMAALWPEEIVA